MPRPKKELPTRADKRWEVKRVVGRDADGKEIKKSFYSRISREDATKKAETYLGGCHVEDITLGDWARRWLTDYKEGVVKESTYSESYERPVEQYIIPEFGHRKMSGIRQNEVQAYINKMAAKYSNSTLRKIMMCLNAIFETAIETDHCAKNPCRRVSCESKKKSAEKRTYTKEQAEIILKMCDGHRFGLTTRILLQMGLRCSELCGLKWEDIDFDKEVMTISRACTEVNGAAMIDVPKSKSSRRRLPIPGDLMVQLRTEKGSGFLVQTANGRYVTPAYYSKARHDRFFAETNFAPKLTPHELRHTCGTLLYDRTHDIYAVSKFLGHANISITTKLYVHDSPEMLRNALFAVKSDEDLTT